MKNAILVTGASGLVGGAVVRHLAAAALPVIAAMRRPNPIREGVAVRPIGDLGPETDWRGALAGAESVVHAAARVHQIDERLDDALAVYRLANRDGTLRLARQAREAGVKRFVFISTAKVMGEFSPQGRPFTENDPPRPVDAYAISKWEAEQELLALDGLECVILRPPLVYGPGVRANLESLMRVLARGLPLPLGAIANRRSLVGVTNLAEAARLALGHPMAPGRTYFVTDTTLSSPELVRQIAQAMGRPARLIPIPPGLIRLGGWVLRRPEIVDRLLGSLEISAQRLTAELGWTPILDPARELARMAEEFRVKQGL
ncbi:MAG: NAD-dependent epimerase/dehydratase family protein [Rhodospirillales bacterium]|nr:NAD-dependent epimerase/dehydratase family protein [Rhodospirillales bacterium]